MVFRRKFVAWIIMFFLVVSIVPLNVVSAQSYGSDLDNDRYYGYSGGQGGSYFGEGGYGAGYFSYQSRPSFQTYYGDKINTYWPQLNNAESCEARTDLLLNVAPVGCQPSVVRSDLLAEQNVPVFCQIDALKINPLIDISSIRNIRFSGTYPEEVAGTGFHPARAALRTYDTLLGSPLVNNVGYVVVVLKKQPIEAELPEFVEINLTAQIDYVAGNAFGIGRTEFLLQPTLTDDEWQQDKLEQTFWNGRYSLRLEGANEEFADVSVYQGERKISTSRVTRDQTSNEIFVPGLYCRAKLQVAYDGLFPAKEGARIEVSSSDGVDVFDVEQGSAFLDGRCRVGIVDVGDSENSGNIQLSCRNYKFDLALRSKGGISLEGLPTPRCNAGTCQIDLMGTSYGNRVGRYVLKADGGFVKFDVNSGPEILLINAEGNFTEDVVEEDKLWVEKLRNELIAFRQMKEGDVQSELDLGEAENYYGRALELYEQVADDYPAEKQNNEEGSLVYGEFALRDAIKLAKEAGDDSSRARLIEKLLTQYPEIYDYNVWDRELSRLGMVDFSEACAAVPFDDKTYDVCLKSFISSSEKNKIELIVSGQRVVLGLGESASEIFVEGNSVGFIRLNDVDFDRVSLGAFCSSNRQADQGSGRSYNLVKGGAEQNICGALVSVTNIDIQEVAKVRLIPSVEGTSTETSFNVKIGIEKRAIQLSPDKALEKVDNLNESIEKWNDLSDNLGNVVETMKGACFATAAALTFKNFLSGLSGEALARQQVMNGPKGWKSICGNDDKCYLDNAPEINADVARVNAALNKVNGKIKPIQEGFTESSGIFGAHVNTDGFKERLAQQAAEDYKDVFISTESLTDGEWMGVERVSVSEVLSNPNTFGVDDIKTIMLNAELQKSGIEGNQAENVEGSLVSTMERINSNRIIESALSNNEQLRREGYAPAMIVEKDNQRNRVMGVIGLNSEVKNKIGFKESTHTSTVVVPDGVTEGGVGFNSGTYVLGLKSAASRESLYNIEEIYYKDETGAKILSNEEKNEFLKYYGIGNIKSAEGALQGHEIIDSDRMCRYYENEPYKGMPAVVPFDSQQGWYAATRQSLPTFGGIGAFDSSGRVTSFWLCNVGENGRVEFESGFGDDLCQQVNLNTGQPLGAFPGLEENEARALVSRAIRAIDDASRQYGSQFINVGGERCQVGRPSVGVPETQCHDFMSPEDCHLMFNVCDPVICPSSRCDLGGTFPVTNVAQTGIVGSALLCLPNIEEGIAVPVCLTGIKAGIDGWVSIMEAYRDCLQANIESGETIGICDEIHSVYLCEFFWGQVAPFMNVLVPKLIEAAYGQGVRGGGEYLTVNAAWQNMQSSVDYFTQEYAVNSLEAFTARTGGQISGASISEIGGEFCKGFVSAKAPSFDSLIEADSPPQFHAWFDVRKFSDSTVPATAQYKVFYHIFAGDDQGVNFLVYLKNPPESSYYSSAPRVTVDSGYIARGEYETQTVDFTAPEGYKELCVRINEDEQCGFKQVSTSFAVNYLRDEIVKNELDRTGITSEEACVGGTPNPGALLNPNLQGGVEETVNPQVYNRGVVRICATQNPGSQTDPSRFVDMGNCGDENVRCWLDSRSVENALTNGGFARNQGAINETLENLRNRTLNTFADDLGFYTIDEAAGAIKKLGQDFQEVKKSSNGLEDKIVDVNDLLLEADFVFDGLFLNNQKAELVLIKAQMNDYIAREYLVRDSVAKKLSAGQIPVIDSGEGFGENVGEGNINETTDDGEVVCDLRNAEWQDLSGEGIENATVEEEISLSVESFGCKGELVFEVYENDLFADDLIVTLDSSGFQSENWVVFGEGDSNSEPEFYFIAKVGDVETRSGDLRVILDEGSGNGVSEGNEQPQEEMAFNERFSIQTQGDGNHYIYYRKFQEDILRPTRLFIVKNTKPLHYDIIDGDIEGNLTRTIESLREGDESCLTVSQEKFSLNILDGEFVLSRLDGSRIIRQGNDLILIPSQSGQATCSPQP